MTGGAGHLGTAISEGLAEAGANVVIASRNVDNCEAMAKRLSAKHPKAIGLKLDVSDERSISEMVEQGVSEFGKIDILINNAYSAEAREEARRKPERMTVQEFENALHNGLTGYFCAVKACVPHMKKQGKGSILNNASMYGMIAPHFQIYRDSEYYSPVNYHACKGGVLQITRYMATYFAKDNIRVNAFSPGPFPHPDILEKDPWFEEELANQNPMHRIGQPWELKGVVVFLASDASSYVTGQNIPVEGGWTIW